MTEDHFRAFYQRTAPAVRAYLRRISGDAALADDLLQDAYVRFLRSDRTALDEDAKKRYLFRIAINLLTDHRRKASRERLSPADLPPAGRPDADPDTRADVEAALASLSSRERAMVWLAYVEGYDHAEIAEAVGVTRLSVRPLLFRARRKLARALHGLGSELGYIEGHLK
jgi:RNA polymerase sigma-70 factor (ECF subfamily)